MNALRTLWSKLRSLTRRGAVKREIDEELRFHIEQRTAENITAGMSLEEAAREARKRFGNLQSVREECRQWRGASFGETVARDIRFAVRMLLRNGWLSAVIILILATAIGLNSAIFSFTNGVLLQSLPFEKPHELVRIYGTFGNPTDRSGFSVPDFRDWRSQTRTLSRFAIHRNDQFTLGGGSVPEKVIGAYVTADFFGVFGVHPLVGRTFLEEEQEPGRGNVVVLSYVLWQRRFGGDTNVVGKSAPLNSVSYTVAGVMPPEFRFPDRADFWIPMSASPPTFIADTDANRKRCIYTGVARIAPQIRIETVQKEMSHISSEVHSRYPPDTGAHGAFVVPLQGDMVSTVRPALIVLSIAVGLVLLIACANVANLLLGRAMVRQKEMAIRCALGAQRLQIIRQLLTESVLLSLAGGAAGLLLAVSCIKVLISIAPANLPRIAEVRLDASVLIFTFSVAVLAGILFGLFPALQISRQNHLSQGKGSGTGRTHHLTRNILVVSEIALSLALLASATLLIRSFINLTNVNSGFDRRQILAARMDLPRLKYNSSPMRLAFWRHLLDEAPGIPGNHSIALVQTLPFGDHALTYSFEIEGRVNVNSAIYNPISANYFQVLKIPLLRGRYFDAQDRSTNASAVIINQTLARRYFPDEDPIGKRLTIEGNSRVGFSIVGIVGDVHQRTLGDAPSPELYVPFEQVGFCPVTMHLVMQTASDPGSITPYLRAIVRAADAELAAGEIRSLESLLYKSVALPRLRLLVLMLLAVVALCLATVGTYSVISYSVNQRSREIGVRMALGAQRGDVLWLVLRQGLKVALAGVVMGIALALALARVMTSLLFEVKPTDPLTFAAVSLLLLVVALLACWLPARRATKVNPMVVLRYE